MHSGFGTWKRCGIAVVAIATPADIRKDAVLRRDTRPLKADVVSGQNGSKRSRFELTPETDRTPDAPRGALGFLTPKSTPQ